MANQDQPDLPKNDGEAGSEELAELDVDALLDQASSLADELSGEVGESANEQDPSANEFAAVDDAPEANSTDVGANAAQAQAEVGGDDLPADGAQVEQELDDLQTVVDSLGVEMSDTSDDETGAIASPDGADADQRDPDSDSAEASVGDASPVDPLPPAELDLAAAANDSGLETPRAAEPADESPELAEFSAEALAFDGPPGFASLDEPGDEARQAPSGRRGGRVAPLLVVLRKAEPLALRIAALGAFLLEMLDRPFGMIGKPIRSLLGMLAIATMATAIVVFVVSFL